MSLFHREMLYSRPGFIDLLTWSLAEAPTVFSRIYFSLQFLRQGVETIQVIVVGMARSSESRHTCRKALLPPSASLRPCASFELPALVQQQASTKRFPWQDDHWAGIGRGTKGPPRCALRFPSFVLAVKIARLYLLSDILHNSSAPVKKASSYRTHLQKGLPEVCPPPLCFSRNFGCCSC